ncbi:MAG: PAS domain-containing protein [Desulfuromonadales bacterium]|nr:PAS domain-containing protein [Desulfuromonadales bacterium]
MKYSARNRFILFAVASYTILALAWIFLSDQLLTAFSDISSLVWLSTAKGVFFVVASAAMFFFALRAVPPAESFGRQTILETLSSGIARKRFPRSIMYAFAVVMTLVTLLVRTSIAIPFVQRPMMILFMFPIILSALLGGLGPGLLSTALAACCVAFFALPPTHSFLISNSHDLLQWSFLVTNGVAVTLLSEMLQRTLARAEENRRLLDTVVSGTPDSVFVKDTQGRYLLANAATAEFIGKPANEIIGHDDSALFPEPSASEVMAIDRVIMTAGCAQTHEEHVSTLDGKKLVFLATKGPVFDDTGQVIGLFGISREISNRKQAEEQIHRLNADLEQRVCERTAELQAANVELKELAYALTHNLGAPLRAINGFSRILLEEHAATLDGEARLCLDQLRDAGEQMGHLIDGILALLRCTSGELRREPVDISSLATRILNGLSRTEPERPVIREVEPNLSVMGDAAMIELALSHLLDNAWKFSRETAHAVIRVFADQVNGQRRICIADNGAGFDDDHRDLLFQPFQRLHRQDEFPGIGIGLATVQRIIHRHGGELTAEGVPGKGATFRFTLPESAVPFT